LKRIKVFKLQGFAGASHIAVFAPTIGTTALFLGLWDIQDTKNNIDFTKKNSLDNR